MFSKGLAYRELSELTDVRAFVTPLVHPSPQRDAKAKDVLSTRIRVLRDMVQQRKDALARDEQEYQSLKDLACGEDEIKRLRILMRMLEPETATVAQLPRKKVEAYPASLRKVNVT